MWAEQEGCLPDVVPGGALVSCILMRCRLCGRSLGLGRLQLRSASLMRQREIPRVRIREDLSSESQMTPPASLCNQRRHFNPPTKEVNQSLREESANHTLTLTPSRTDEDGQRKQVGYKLINTTDNK